MLNSNKFLYIFHCYIYKNLKIKNYHVKKVRELSEQKLFEVFVNKMQFKSSDYLISSTEAELSDFQKRMIEDASSIMKDNIVGEIKSFGGNLKKNEEKFKEFEKKAEEELENEEYKELKKEIKDYIKKLKEFIDKTCFAIIPVKEMPWVDIIFRTVPRIFFFDKKIQFLDNQIAYYGEIKSLITRPTIFGKIKDEKPLFAPVMGTLDLGGYKLDDSQIGQKSQIYPYVSAVINSLDSSVTKSHLAKYATSFQRHGDPICDFLIKDEELMKAMENLTSSIESNRLASDMAISGIAIPLPADKTTLLLVTDEGKEQNRFSKCFEAFLRFSAECCKTPYPSKETPMGLPQPPEQGSTQQPGAIRTPGGQELKTWTAEELVSEAQKRLSTQPDMPSWSEDEILKFAAERSTALPEGMEVWTEEELQNLAKKRQGGLDIPEWETDKDLGECLKCGYSLRPGWTRCPVCETPKGAEPEPEPIEQPNKEPSKNLEEESSKDMEEKSSDSSVEEKEDQNS